jgi:thiamine biosynthesis protein ThiC
LRALNGAAGEASDIDWRLTASPQRRRLLEQASQFRWEDQFNLSLDPERGLQEKTKEFLKRGADVYAKA